MKRKFFGILLTLVMIVSLVGCGTKKEEASTGGKNIKIGISMPTKSLERWNRDGSYLKKEFEALGYTAELTYSDNKSDQQVNDIQNLIADKVNLLVIVAIDGEGLSTVLKEAKDQNIPVIAYHLHSQGLRYQ
jgi:putative multiple sugar transport system substrate-binding protein